MGDIFEMLMVVSFGFAWPASIVRSWRSRTAKGKSLSFLIIILAGYVFGITAKFVNMSVKPLNYVLVFYFLNFIMVAFDMLLYFRNKKLDIARGEDRQADPLRTL